MTPFSHLGSCVGFKHLYSCRVAACAQTGIQCHNINLSWLGPFVPTYLPGSKQRFLLSLQFDKYSRSNKCFIVDDEFTSNFSSETISSQLSFHTGAPLFAAIRVFLPITTKCFESVYAQRCWITIFIFAL